MPTKHDRARESEIKVWLTVTRPAARDLFELLGVNKGDSTEAIGAARNKLAGLLHPDRWESQPRRKDDAAKAMAEVNMAHAILTTKDKRLKYLAELAGGRSACPGCKGEGYTSKQKGFTDRIRITCTTCGGSGLFKDKK
jgi:DnaJ-class molecular chaperone